MIILVSDTSVLIDLEHGDLLEPAFACGIAMAVPDLLYERELEEENGPYLCALGLAVTTLTPDETALAQSIQSKRTALSLPDCFALCCARRPNHALVTGDSILRKEAESLDMEVHGVLWLLDQMEATGMVTHAALHEGLMRIQAHRNCRLPGEEIRRRLLRWGG